MTTDAVSSPSVLPPSEDRAPRLGSLRGRTVEELQTEVLELEKQLKRRNAYVRIATLTSFAAGIALLATGLATGCLPLALSSISLIVIGNLIPSLAGYKHIHPDVFKALHSQEHISFISQQKIPLHPRTLLKSYDCFLKQQKMENEIHQHLSTSAEDVDPALKEFAENYGLATASNNRAQARALFQSKQEIERQIAELRIMEESPQGCSDFIKVTYPQF